jgi:hypothetical protein
LAYDDKEANLVAKYAIKAPAEPIEKAGKQNRQ